MRHSLWDLRGLKIPTECNVRLSLGKLSHIIQTEALKSSNKWRRKGEKCGNSVQGCFDSYYFCRLSSTVIIPVYATTVINRQCTRITAAGRHAWRQDFPLWRLTWIKDTRRAEKLLHLLTKGKWWSLSIPSTKSFTLVKSTLFLLVELTLLSPSGGTWPWTRRRGKAKTLAIFITCVDPQIIPTYFNALIRTCTQWCEHESLPCSLTHDSLYRISYS